MPGHFPDYTEHLKQIEDCEHRSERLDNWSVTFIDSIKRQIEGDNGLSLKQAEKLDEIWERATAKG